MSNGLPFLETVGDGLHWEDFIIWTKYDVVNDLVLHFIGEEGFWVDYSASPKWCGNDFQTLQLFWLGLNGGMEPGNDISIMELFENLVVELSNIYPLNQDRIEVHIRILY